MARGQCRCDGGVDGENIRVFQESQRATPLYKPFSVETLPRLTWACEWIWKVSDFMLALKREKKEPSAEKSSPPKEPKELRLEIVT